MMLALAVKPLVETFVKNYVTPSLAKVLHSVAKSSKQNLMKCSEAFADYYEHAYESYSIINTLAFKERVKNLKDIYIPLTLSLSGNHYKKHSVKINSYPKKLLDKYPRILITDTAGMGKSTLMKRMFLDVIDNNYGVPFFVELRRVNDKNDILCEISTQMGTLDKKFDEEMLVKLFQAGGNIFFFDGYDEIPSNQKAFVTRNIQEFVIKVPNNQFILTSRPDEELAGLGNFQDFKIEQLKRGESYELLKKYDNYGKISELLINKLNSGNYSMISEFLKNPLLVTLLFAAFDYKQIIPLKKHIFYRQVFDAYFDSHDLSKGDGFVHEKKSKLDIDDFDRVMRKIGFECLRRQQIEFPKDDMLNIIDQARNQIPSLPFSSNALLTDLLKAVPLFCQDGIYYKWVHKSLQEYFAAEFIYKDSKNSQDAILKKLCGSNKIDSYINLLDLYFDIDPNGFQKNVVKPVLESYVNFYEQNFIPSLSLPQDEIGLRLTMLFSNRILVGRIVYDCDDKSDDHFKKICGICHEKVGEIPISTMLIGNGSYIAKYSNNYHKLLQILERRIPQLFGEVVRMPRKLDIVISQNVFELKGMNDFINNKELFVKLNMLMTGNDDKFYIIIDNAKKYLQMINSMISQSCEKDDLLSGL